jgi:ABC-type histidine transport system ATPase subunit
MAVDSERRCHQPVFGVAGREKSVEESKGRATSLAAVTGRLIIITGGSSSGKTGIVRCSERI